MTSCEYRLVVIGAGGVGKSAITVRFTGGNFVEKYDPTIEDSYRKSVEVDGQACMLDIMDTAGQEEYRALRDQYMKSGDGFLLVYSVTSTTSFEAVPRYRQEIVKCKEDAPDVPILLVGNKIDMEAERVVRREDAIALAHKCSMTHAECSAKTNVHVQATFFELIRLVDKHRQKRAARAAAAAASRAKGHAKQPRQQRQSSQPRRRPQHGGACALL